MSPTAINQIVGLFLITSQENSSKRKVRDIDWGFDTMIPTNPAIMTIRIMMIADTFTTGSGRKAITPIRVDNIIGNAPIDTINKI